MSPILLTLFVAGAQAEPLVAVVVVDEEAREHGYALELDGWLVDDALPVDVVDGDVVRLITPEGRAETLDVGAGEAWEISGPAGEAWMSALEEEVRTDRIAVRGSARAIEALARSLGAEVIEHEGVTYVHGHEVLLDAPWVADPVAQRVREVRFVPVDDGAEERVDSEPEPPRRPVALRAVAVPTVAQPAPKGVESAMVGDATPTSPTLVKVEEPPAVPVDEGAEEKVAEAPQPAPETVELDQLERYAGLYLCRDTPLYLHPAGVYLLGEHQGSWRVSSPGVVRLLGPDGELWYRAAIEADRSFCRELWTELTPVDGRSSRKRRAALREVGPR